MTLQYFKAKIGREDHLHQLQKEGIVYCNTLKYFAELEDEQIRGDKDESAFEFKTFNDSQLLINPVSEPNSEFIKLKLNWGQMITRNSEPYGNLFCIYCVNIPNGINEGQIVVDEKIGSFGSHVLVILNSQIFEEKLFEELQARKLKYHFGNVEYIDLKKHSGKKTLFQKDLTYSYQNEFRIFMENDKLEPISLKLGDISDISRIYDFNTFQKLMYKHP